MFEWTLVYPVRPWTLNSERTWHHYKRAKYVKEWREAYCALALAQGVPAVTAIEVEATPYLSGRGRTQDVGACFPAVKAAVDGLVDAGVIPEDNPTYVKMLSFRAPQKGKKGENSLLLTIRAVS